MLSSGNATPVDATATGKIINSGSGRVVINGLPVTDDAGIGAIESLPGQHRRAKDQKRDQKLANGGGCVKKYLSDR